MTVCDEVVNSEKLYSGEIDINDEALYYNELDEEIFDENNLLRLEPGCTVGDMIAEAKEANSNWFFLKRIFIDPKTGEPYHGITVLDDPICKPVDEYREAGRYSQVRPKGFVSKLANDILVDLQNNGFKFDEDRMIVAVTIDENDHYHYEIFEGHHRDYIYDNENISHMVATGIIIDEDVIAEHYGDVESFVLKIKTQLNRDPSACGATDLEDFVTLIQDDILKHVSKKTASSLSDLNDKQKAKINETLICKYIEDWSITDGRTAKAVKSRLLAWILNENPQASMLNGMYNYQLPGTKRVVDFKSYDIATIALGQHEEFPNVIGGWGADQHFNYPHLNKLDQFAYTVISATNIADQIPYLLNLQTNYFIAKLHIDEGLETDDEKILSNMKKIEKGNWPSQFAPVAFFSAIDLNNKDKKILTFEDLEVARVARGKELEKAFDNQASMMKSLLMLIEKSTENLVNRKCISSSSMNNFVNKEIAVFAGHYPHHPEKEQLTIGSTTDLRFKKPR